LATLYKLNFCKSEKTDFTAAGMNRMAMEHARNVDKCHGSECYSTQRSIS